jgi:hypothetical protein
MMTFLYGYCAVLLTEEFNGVMFRGLITNEDDSRIDYRDTKRITRYVTGTIKRGKKKNVSYRVLQRNRIKVRGMTRQG